MGRYNRMRSRQYSGAFVPLNINTTHVGNASCSLKCAILLQSLLCKRGHQQLHVANAMLEMG